MSSILSIYTTLYEKYHKLLTTILQEELNGIDADEIVYTILLRNGLVYEIPIKLEKAFYHYLEHRPTHSNPLNCYTNILILPTVIPYPDLRYFASNSDQLEIDFIESILDGEDSALLISSYHMDTNISLLTLYFKDRERQITYMDKYIELRHRIQCLYQKITTHLYDLSEFLISEEFSGYDFQKPTCIELTHPLIQQLSIKELQIIWFLYQGIHSAKEIAPMIALSHRTVEDKLNALMKKLGFSTKYEFLMYISGQHSLMRHLLYKRIIT
ncbi:helix-turn-helix transcriptional regulator [Cysteiniphilum litorale]|uniref:helix-turn-helix transcriptional regulator n=1 Tax=Cysteiniphilum litorale TaxID=2056700 RepID=UPI003F8807A5